MPPCRWSLPTRAITMMKSAARALLIQILRPLHPLIAVQHRTRLHGGGIATRSRLRDRDRRRHAALDIWLHVLFLLRVGADCLQHAQVRRVRRQHERHAATSEFFMHCRHRARRKIVAAEILGRIEAPKPQFP